MARSMFEADKFKLSTDFYNDYVVHLTSERKVLATWKRDKSLGIGASGVVWREKDDKGQLRAVKSMLRDKVLSPNSLAHELAALIRLRDRDNLFVKFLGWYENNNSVYLAMEYVGCGDLSQYIADREKAIAGAKTITRQILEGLSILHGEGICHRDLKPQNILVASRIPLRIKIADFGTSKRAENTVLRTKLGTPAYSAPELMGSSMTEFTNALDIWSLGILVHEVLTSKRPFFDQAAFGDDSEDISGLASFSTTKSSSQAVDSPLLFGYYYGKIEFPVEDLETSGASPEAIRFVRGLLAARPEDRPTASAALRDVWLYIDQPEYGHMHSWLEALESELSVLGIDLRLQEDQKQKLWEGGDEVDIMQLMSDLERKAYSSLLEQAVAKGLTLLVPMLLRSQNYQQERMGRLSLEHLFHKAVKARRTAMIQLLQSKGADICALLEGKSALYCAAERGDTEIAKVLLELGLDNDAKTNTRDHETALQVAALYGHLGVVQLLLSHKADVNATGYPPNRLTAIQAAASSGNIDIVELMLHHGADINGPLYHEEGRTALQAAAQFGNDAKIVKLLLERGAEINANPSQHFGRTALQAACEIGSIEMVGLLLHEGANVNAEPATRGGRTALQAACEGGHLAVVKILLEHGANVSAEPSSEAGVAALEAAAGSGSLDIMNLLLGNGVKPTCFTLTAAARGGHMDIVKFLLDMGIDRGVEADYKGGLIPTPMQAASRAGHLDMVKMLFSHGFSCCEPAKEYGRTALQAAAEGGHIRIARFLVVNGASVHENGSSFGGRAAIQAAAERGHAEMVSFLLGHGASVNTAQGYLSGPSPIQAAVENGHVEVINVLLANKVDLTWDCVVTPGAPSRKILQIAAGSGYIGIVELLLGTGLDINYPDNAYNPSVLQLAAEKGDISMVRFLLSKGADPSPNIPIHASTGLVSPLKAAVICELSNVNKGRHMDLINLLLDHGAAVNSASSLPLSNPSALHLAVRGGHIELVRILLKRGAEVNTLIPFSAEQTALEAAVEGGHVETVKLLLQNGARPNNPQAGSIDNFRPSALLLAVLGESLDLAKLLLQKGASVKSSTPTLGTPLAAATRLGNTEMIKLLLSFHADINDMYSGDPMGTWITALEVAASAGNIEIVRLLLANGADARLPALGYGSQPLQTAARGGHRDILDLLLQNGADINASPCNTSGRTALQAAAEYGNRDIVEFLLERMADVNAEPGSGGGRTALQAAAGGGHLEIVEILLQRKADVNAEAAQREGRTALQAAAEAGHLDIVKLLLQCGANFKARASGGSGTLSVLQAAAAGGNIEIFNLVSDLHSDFDAEVSVNADEDPTRVGSRTALQAAAGGGHTEMVKHLLTLGAHINAPAALTSGRTALQAAAGNGHIKTVELLLQYGADINAPGSAVGGGQMALQAAVDGGHVEIVKILLHHGADVNIEPSTSDNRSVLSIAKYNRHDELVDILTRSGARDDDRNVKMDLPSWFSDQPKILDIHTDLETQANAVLDIKPASSVPDLGINRKHTTWPRSLFSFSVNVVGTLLAIFILFSTISNFFCEFSI